MDINRIFEITNSSQFNKLALEIFNFQYDNYNKRYIQVSHGFDRTDYEENYKREPVVITKPKKKYIPYIYEYGHKR